MEKSLSRGPLFLPVRRYPLVMATGGGAEISKLETPMTRAYWATLGGMLLEEFPLVRRSSSASARWIDGLVILDGAPRVAGGREVSVAGRREVPVPGRDIVLIQTKAQRLGMYLLGQALFPAELMRPFKPRSVRTV